MSFQITPDRLLHVFGDEEFREYSPAEQRLIERHADALTYEKLGNRDWWEGRLEGVNTMSLDADGVLARCMVNLPGLRRGEKIALDAVITALSQLERLAIGDARGEALKVAEDEFEAGELAT